MIVDALGLPVALSAEPETTSRGVALLALRSLRMIERFDERPVSLKIVGEPDIARFARHQAAIAERAALYERLR